MNQKLTFDQGVFWKCEYFTIQFLLDLSLKRQTFSQRFCN